MVAAVSRRRRCSAAFAVAEAENSGGGSGCADGSVGGSDETTRQRIEIAFLLCCGSRCRSDFWRAPSLFGLAADADDACLLGGGALRSSS